MKVKAKSNIHTDDIDGLENEDITIGEVYSVIGIEGDYYRLVNDVKEPVLYPKILFDIIDPDIPDNWLKTEYEGELFLGPIETSRAGFYEDYFDGNKDNINIYKKMLIKISEK